MIEDICGWGEVANDVEIEREDGDVSKIDGNGDKWELFEGMAGLGGCMELGTSSRESLWSPASASESLSELSSKRSDRYPVKISFDTTAEPGIVWCDVFCDGLGWVRFELDSGSSGC